MKMKNKMINLFEQNMQQLKNNMLPTSTKNIQVEQQEIFVKQHLKTNPDQDFITILSNYVLKSKTNVNQIFTFERQVNKTIKTETEMLNQQNEQIEEVNELEPRQVIDYFKPTENMNDLQEFLSGQLKQKKFQQYIQKEDSSESTQLTQEQQISDEYTTDQDKEENEQLQSQLSDQDLSQETDKIYEFQLNQSDQNQNINYNELSEESDEGTKKPKVVIQQPVVSDHEIYNYYMPVLIKQITDFELSDQDDSEFVRKRSRNKATGEIIGKNVWTEEYINKLKAYVYHLKSNLIRIHFGPLVPILKKSRADLKQKYQELYMQKWEQKQRQELLNLVKQQMKQNCYVDFKQIAELLNKTVDSCIETYCKVIENKWDLQMDEALTEYVFNSQEKPPFWSVLGYELGIYELACAKRYYQLKLNVNVVWQEDEIELLKQFWDQFKQQKTRTIFKQEIRRLLPRHKISEVREKLVENGIKLDLVAWE